MENINIAEKIEELENALISILKVSKNNFYRYTHPQFFPPHTILKYRKKQYIIFFGNDNDDQETGDNNNQLFKSRLGALNIGGE